MVFQNMKSLIVVGPVSHCRHHISVSSFNKVTIVALILVLTSGESPPFKGLGELQLWRGPKTDQIHDAEKDLEALNS